MCTPEKSFSYFNDSKTGILNELPQVLKYLFGKICIALSFNTHLMSVVGQGLLNTKDFAYRIIVSSCNSITNICLSLHEPHLLLLPALLPVSFSMCNYYSSVFMPLFLLISNTYSSSRIAAYKYIAQLLTILPAATCLQM